MKNPNFFIIGAPKCGTTSLYRYLSDHPQIYFSPLKEPHFFTADDEGRNFHSLQDYLKLFDEAESRHKAVGEASVLYLYSECAVKNILRFNPSARLIVMLRHPVDMFFSFHQQNQFRLRETVRDPQAAWNLQTARAAGRHLPRGCREPRSLQYKAVCSLGTQMERLLATAPPEQILVISFNEFCQNTQAIYERVLDFLGLDQDGRTDFSRENTAKLHRSLFLARILGFTAFTRRPMFGQCVAASKTKHQDAFWFAVRRLLERLRELNTKPWKPVVDPVFACELHAVFADEVNKIKELTGLELKSRYARQDMGESL